jgi:nicotinamide riboside kinase
MTTGLFKRVLFLGGESSGKSTISKAAAKHYGAPLVEEYGRTFYEKKGVANAVFEDLSIIGRQQIKNELVALKEAAFYGATNTFYDTSLLVTYFYSMQWYGKSTKWLKDTAAETLYTYNVVFVCENDFPFVQDGQREGIDFAKKQHDFYVFVLEKFNIPYHVLTGSVSDRLTQIEKILGVPK